MAAKKRRSRKKGGRPPESERDRLFHYERFRKWIEDSGFSYPDVEYEFRRTAEQMGLRRKAGRSVLWNWANGRGEPQITDYEILKRMTGLSEGDLVRKA